MTELTNVPDQIAAPESEDQPDKRRLRLQALRSQLSAGAGQGASQPKARAAGRAANPARAGDRAGANNKASAQRRAAAQIYQLLTETPADDSGLVEGTPFTHTGVARALETLRARTSKDGTLGAKVAGRVLKFLTPSGGEGAVVHNVSVDKLKRVARLARALELGREKPL